MKFIRYHVKNVVSDSFLLVFFKWCAGGVITLSLFNHSGQLWLLHSDPYFETETMLVHQLTTEGTVRIETYYSQLTDIHSFVGFFKKCMDEKPYMYVISTSCFQANMRSWSEITFLQALFLFLTFTLNPPPPKQKKNGKQKSDGALQLGSCAEFIVWNLHNMYFSFFFIVVFWQIFV